MSAFENLDRALEWAARRLNDLAFIGPDPHYAIGLDAFVPGLVVAVADASPALEVMRSAGVEGIAVADDEDSGRNALAVLQHPRTRELLRRRSIGKALVFKSSHALETEAAQAGVPLMAAPAALGRRWENKSAFIEIGRGLGLNLPKSLNVELAQADYHSLAQELGPALVVQAPHGYAGARTLHVVDEAGFEHAQSFIRSPIARVASYVDGRPMTLNACVTAGGIAIGSPFIQLTGLDAFTPHRLGSCGQIWRSESDEQSRNAEMIAAAEIIGSALAGEGFRGVFGVDFVVPPDGPPYVIEVNPRLVASIAAYTQLELAAGRVPLLLRHLAAFVEPDADRVPLTAHQGPLDGAQVVLHNVQAVDSIIPAGLGGAWRASEGRWRREESASGAIRLGDIGPGDAIVLTGPPGKKVAPGAEWARVQRGPLQVGGRKSGGRPDGDRHSGETLIALAEMVAVRLGAGSGPDST